MTFENNTPLDQVDDRTLQEGKVIDQAIADQMQIKQEIATDQKPVTLQAPISKTTLAESTSNQYQNPDLIKDFIITPKDTQRLLLILNTKNIREFSINLWKWMKERFPAMTKDMVYSRQIYNGRSGSQSEYYTFEVLSRGLAIVVPALKLKLDQMLSKQ